MPEKKAEKHSIVITFTIDPALKLNARGERCMAVSVVARQGDVGQVSRFDMINWKADIAAEVDRLMRLLMSGSLTLPEFPDMSEKAAAATGSVKPEQSEETDAPEEVTEPAAHNELPEADDRPPSPEVYEEDSEDYEITFYDAAGGQEGDAEAEGADSAQPALW
jgi:hypothetical protein